MSRSLIIDGLLFIAIGLMVVLTARHIFRLRALEKGKAVMKQKAFIKTGGLLGTIGMVIAIVVPRLTGVRDRFDDAAKLAYLLITILGFALFLVGLNLQISAYKTEEETPKWMRRLLGLWSSFWRE